MQDIFFVYYFPLTGNTIKIHVSRFCFNILNISHFFQHIKNNIRTSLFQTYYSRLNGNISIIYYSLLKGNKFHLFLSNNICSFVISLIFFSFYIHNNIFKITIFNSNFFSVKGEKIFIHINIYIILC